MNKDQKELMLKIAAYNTGALSASIASLSMAVSSDVESNIKESIDDLNERYVRLLTVFSAISQLGYTHGDDDKANGSISDDEFQKIKHAMSLLNNEEAEAASEVH